MGFEIKISSKGQIVIPKQIRDALSLKPGETLAATLHGRRIVLDAPEPAGERISYEEFRRRVPRWTGKPATLEEMDAAVARMFAERGVD